MHVILKEGILVSFIGVVPAVIIQSRGGIESLKSFVNSAVAPEVIFYYFLSFFLCHLALALAYKPYIGNVPPERRATVKNQIELFGEVGAGLLGIYRLVGGLLFAIPLLWLAYDKDTLPLSTFFLMEGFSCLFFLGICLMSSSNKWANERL